jgi:4'-phosphopantetheinyl transferase
MSVSILYYKVSPDKISSVHDSEQLMTWISELPEVKQRQIKKLRQPRDQILSLAGLQLLKRSIPDFSLKPFSLADIQFPDKSKPMIPGDIDFNISHSGDMVCCVVSNEVKVGIDIELHRPVYGATMKKFLALNKKAADENEIKEFFSIWTKKEAIIKAANYGSIYNMDNIILNQAGGYYQDHFWPCYTVDIISAADDNAYTCHVACSEPVNKINIKQIHEL